MPRQIKVSTILIFALAVLFFVFFDQSKHSPALAGVNTFNVDPYDAVGSFGFLLANFTGLLSLVRAFRPYATKETAAHQTLLILRGQAVTLLSIAITLAADTIAMLRNPSMAFGSPAGLTLTALVAGLGLPTVLSGWWVYRSAQSTLSTSTNNPWRRAITICLAGIIILAVYPPGWDHGVVGEILTALVGMLILFVPLWVLATAIFPPVNFEYEDSMDDAVAIYRWLKVRSGFGVKALDWLEKAAARPQVRAMGAWLNPRKHRWNFVILIAFGTGIALASAEAIGEGASPDLGRFALIMSIFIGLGGTGVILGYFSLANFLGIFRKS